MEKYFQFLIGNIFGLKASFGDTSGPDAVIEGEKIVIVMEFTTEYYRMSSLYNPTIDGFIEDTYRLLFSTGESDSRSRKKKDCGKLIKLNEYIARPEYTGKIVIPVLVTENTIGDHNLFDEFDNFYSKEIAGKSLGNLAENTPLFLSLDDLETFWGLFVPEDALAGFSQFAQYWLPEKKGPHFHSVSSGICRFVESQRGEARICNDDYSKFFASKVLADFKAFKE